MPASWTLLRDARRAAGLTQAELARRVGMTQSAVSQMERPGSNPTVDTLDAVLAATGRRLTMSTEPRASNIDETLLARNMRMTPGERIAAFERNHAEVGRLRGLIARGQDVA